MRNRFFQLRTLLDKIFRRNGNDDEFVGVDSREFLCSKLKDRPRPLILDVGANRGQSAWKYIKLFPGCTIHSFEPFTEMYEKLCEINYPKLYTYNFGLSDQNDKEIFFLNLGNPTNSLLELEKNASQNWGNIQALTSHKSLECEFYTVDWFLDSEGITKVDFMKIDVQGAEYKVLKGARSSLDNKIIDLIQLEFLFVPTYKNQKSFDEYIKLMKKFDYHLVMITDIATVGDRVVQADLFFSHLCRSDAK